MKVSIVQPRDMSSRQLDKHVQDSEGWLEPEMPSWVSSAHVHLNHFKVPL